MHPHHATLTRSLLSSLALGAAVLWAPAAHAAPTFHLAGGAGAGIQDQSGPSVFGRLVIDGERFGGEAGVRESALGVGGDLVNGGLAQSDGTFVGAISLLARMPVGPVVLRAGLAHHHETPAPAVTDAPMPAIAGTHPSILHRSGFEAGAEYLLPLAKVGATSPFLKRVDLLGAASADWIPADVGAPVTVWLEAGLRVRLGRE